MIDSLFTRRKEAGLNAPIGVSRNPAVNVSPSLSTPVRATAGSTTTYPIHLLEAISMISSFLIVVGRLGETV